MDRIEASNITTADDRPAAFPLVPPGTLTRLPPLRALIVMASCNAVLWLLVAGGLMLVL